MILSPCYIHPVLPLIFLQYLWQFQAFQSVSCLELLTPGYHQKLPGKIPRAIFQCVYLLFFPFRSSILKQPEFQRNRSVKITFLYKHRFIPLGAGRNQVDFNTRMCLDKRNIFTKVLRELRIIFYAGKAAIPSFKRFINRVNLFAKTQPAEMAFVAIGRIASAYFYLVEIVENI